MIPGQIAQDQVAKGIEWALGCREVWGVTETGIVASGVVVRGHEVDDEVGTAENEGLLVG